MRTLLNAVSLLLLSAVMWSITSVEVAAQDRRELVDIKVTNATEPCDYEVQEAGGTVIPGQHDLFFVKAGAFLRIFTDRETFARVRIEDDSLNGVRGYAHRGSARLFPGLTQIIRVRRPIHENGGSRHKVRIDCCDTITNDGVCINPVEADAASGGKGGAGAIDRASGPAETEDPVTPSGSTPLPTGPPAPGGPDMDIQP